MRAKPELVVLRQGIRSYLTAVSFFAHESMLAPFRIVPKGYDHILIWHMYDLAVWMDDDAAMSVAAASSSGLESLNKFLKQKKRANTSGGFAVGKDKT